MTNNTNQPLNLKLPEAFAGVPVAAQFGGAGGGRGGGGGGRVAAVAVPVAAAVGNSKPLVAVAAVELAVELAVVVVAKFSVPPEKTAKIDMAVVCLEHGLRDPSSSAPYKMVPADAVVDRPAVVELLKAFGRGELKHGAAQAAAWNLNNDLSWQQLAAKLQGTKRSFKRPPYFSADEIRTGMAYATEATRLAQANADEHEREERASRKARQIGEQRRPKHDRHRNQRAGEN